MRTDKWQYIGPKDNRKYPNIETKSNQLLNTSLEDLDFDKRCNHLYLRCEFKDHGANVEGSQVPVGGPPPAASPSGTNTLKWGARKGKSPSFDPLSLFRVFTSKGA
jgi:hypothetical protein